MIDIIVLNNGKGIEETLLSIYTQTIKNKIKVYIVGDRPIKHIKEFEKRLDIEKVKCSNSLGEMKSLGLEKSNNEYIMFINSGSMFYNPLSLEKIYDMRDKYDIVLGKVVNEICDYSFYNVQGNLYKREFIKKEKIKFNDSDGLNNGFNQLAILSGANYTFSNYNTIYSKQDIDKYLISDSIYALTIMKNNNIKEIMAGMVFELFVLINDYSEDIICEKSDIDQLKVLFSKKDFHLNNKYIKEILERFLKDKDDYKKIIDSFYH